MTNEEAIETLRKIALYVPTGVIDPSNFYSALDLAIKTLERSEQGEWTPVSEGLPDNEAEVLIQYGQSIMVGYHMWDFTVYPSEFADENETGWYDCKDDFICGSDEVTAWQPLPKPYKKGNAE